MEPVTQPWRTIDCDESADVIRTTSVKLWGIHAINGASSIRYLKLYNTASPTVGTTTPVLTLAVPSSGGAEGGGFTWPLHGMLFPDGAAIACTTGRADNDTGAPSAGDVMVNLEVS